MSEEAPSPTPKFARHAGRQAETCLSAAELVLEALTDGRPVDQVLRAHYRANHNLGSRDRRLISEVVFSLLRWYGWLKELDLETACAAAYLLDHEGELPPAVEELVARSKLSAEPLQKLPAKASIEDKGAALAQALGLETAPLRVEVLPEDLSGLLPAQPEGIYDQWIDQIQMRAPAWIRVKQRERDRVIQWLDDQGIDYTPQPGVPCALGFSDPSVLNRIGNELKGTFEVQDISSQCVGLVCDPTPDDVWMDPCCGSGGKTFHLNDLMGYSNRIFASDRRPNILREFHRRANVNFNRKVRPHELDLLNGELLHNHFDGVVVDAPCSGLGTWAHHPGMRWQFDPKSLRGYGSRQIRMLERAAEAVKPGGKLVYAVCSITRKETTDVIERFLQTHKGRWEADAFPHPLNPTETCSDGSLLLAPWDYPGDGMFIARLRKVADRVDDVK